MPRLIVTFIHHTEGTVPDTTETKSEEGPHRAIQKCRALIEETLDPDNTSIKPRSGFYYLSVPVENRRLIDRVLIPRLETMDLKDQIRLDYEDSTGHVHRMIWPH